MRVPAQVVDRARGAEVDLDARDGARVEAARLVDGRRGLEAGLGSRQPRSRVRKAGEPFCSRSSVQPAGTIYVRRRCAWSSSNTTTP